MRKISIEITKARLTTILIEIKEKGLPEIDATVSLLSFNNKHIAEYKATSGSWKTPKMDLPVEVYFYIKKI